MGIWDGKEISLTGFGHELPGKPQPIAELPVVTARNVEPHVLSRLGIDTLYLSQPEENALDLGERAARRAIADAGAEPSDIDVIVVSNSSERRYVPELGPRLAHRVGATGALGFDVCGGCAGFVLGVQTAASFLVAQQWRKAVVVATEQFSRLAKPATPDTLVAGDAAGAVVLSRGEETERKLIDSVVLSDGEEAEVFSIDESSGYLRYNARRLFDLAVRTQIDVAKDLLDRNGLTIADLDLFAPHPGSRRVIQGVVDGLGIPPDKVITTFASTGNTVSAMIPTALSVRKANSDLRPGARLLATAAGAGWYGGGFIAVI